MVLGAPEGMMAQTYDALGRAQLGLENYGQAAAMFDKALAEKGTDSLRRRADVSAAQRRFAEAEALLQAMTISLQFCFSRNFVTASESVRISSSDFSP